MTMTTEQDALPGTTPTRVKFLGTKYDTLMGDFKIDDEHEFTVRGVVKAVGDEKVKDGHIGHVVKIEVTSVSPVSFTEPDPPPGDPTLPVGDDADGE
jgi:hypothetical protein